MNVHQRMIGSALPKQKVDSSCCSAGVWDVIGAEHDSGVGQRHKVILSLVRNRNKCKKKDKRDLRSSQNNSIHSHKFIIYSAAHHAFHSKC
jgi:hypothetical protein